MKSVTENLSDFRRAPVMVRMGVAEHEKRVQHAVLNLVAENEEDGMTHGKDQHAEPFCNINFGGKVPKHVLKNQSDRAYRANFSDPPAADGVP